jgi:pyruvate/2-oxoglutarate/acetoin dehydrogenase E1 component
MQKTLEARKMNLVQAVNDALRGEMKRDEKVILLGEDIAKLGGVFRASDGLLKEFGPKRVIDTPVAEAGIVGMAMGMSLYGLNPVAEIMFADFMHLAFDMVVTELSKYRYRSAGQFAPHVVIRAPYGGGVRGAQYHSQSPESYYVHTAGLKVIIPSNPSDAKGLLTSAIRDPDPVIFLEPKKIYHSVKEEVPEGEHLEPIGKARIVQEGSDVTLISYGAMFLIAKQAAEQLTRVSVELIDLRTLLPYDGECILNSVKKTGRLVIVHEAPKTLGFGAELAAFVAERALDYLKAPIMRVTGYDIPYPYTNEEYYLPDANRVKDYINKAMSH